MYPAFAAHNARRVRGRLEAVNDYGVHPAKNQRVGDATFPVGRMASVPDLRAGPSQLLQDRTVAGGGLIARADGLFKGSWRAGGNNPTVRPNTDKQIKETIVYDSSKVKLGDVEAGQLIFVQASYEKRNDGYSETRNSVLYNGKSLGRLNYLMKRPGELRQKLQSLKTAVDVERVTGFRLFGVQTNQMPPQDNNQWDTDKCTGSICTRGPILIADLAAHWRRKHRDRPHSLAAACGDYMYLLLRKHREENPYTASHQGKDYDPERRRVWDANIDAQYYWSYDPICLSSPVVPEPFYTYEDPDGHGTYRGKAERVGLVKQLQDRITDRMDWYDKQQEAVYPSECNSDYLLAYQQLPTIQVVLCKG